MKTEKHGAVAVLARRLPGRGDNHLSSELHEPGKEDRNRKSRGFIAIGVGVGLAIGTATGNIAVGIGVGVALAVALHSRMGRAGG